LLQLSEYSPFADAFASSYVLHWLYSISFPISGNCSYCGDIRSPNLALLRLFNAADGFKNLKKVQTKTLLDSHVIFNGNYPEEDSPNIILITEYLFGHLKDLGHEGIYPRAAAACTVILDREREVNEATPLQWLEVRKTNFGAQDFLDWETTITTMINELNGLILPIKEEPWSAFLSHETTPTRIMGNSAHVGHIPRPMEENLNPNIPAYHSPPMLRTAPPRQLRPPNSELRTS
jgi:hypothetical protein